MGKLLNIRYCNIKVISVAAITSLTIYTVHYFKNVFSNPIGIPSPPIPPHPGDGFIDRYIKRFFMQHFYIVRKEESMFRLLYWTRLFNHKPFLMRIFFRKHIVLSRAEDFEEVLLKQESGFCKRTGYDLLRTVIGDGLLAMVDKKKHKIHRKILESTFTSSNVKGLANEIMRVHVLRMLNTFFDLVLCAGDGVVTINIADYMHRMALGIISAAAFRASREDSVIVLEAFSAMTKFNKLNYFCPYLRTREQKEAENILIDVSTALMQETNDESIHQRRVVLDALIEEYRKNFNDNDVVNHLITFLFAGHDTTSNTLNFLFALLARNERVQQKLFEELEILMPASCTCPTIEELLQCEYLLAVVREGMRLFPTAPLLYRDALKDICLPASHINIPKGYVCVLNIFSLHRNAEMYGGNVDEFYPERWLGEAGNKLKKECGRCGYIPFSVGLRNCIGQEYGIYEILIAIAVLFRHLQLQPVGQFPRTRFIFTMSSPDPCRVKLILRNGVSREAMLKGRRVQQEYDLQQEEVRGASHSTRMVSVKS